MELLTPKGLVVPKDTSLIETEPARYARMLLKTILDFHRNVADAFKRLQYALTAVVDVEAGTFTPQRVSQALEPTLVVGQAMIWRDTTASKLYLVYNDADAGQKKVELI